MIWPFSAGVVRLAVAAGGGAIAATYFAADTTPLFACLSAGLVCFGGLISGSLFSRVWNPRGS